MAMKGYINLFSGDIRTQIITAATRTTGQRGSAVSREAVNLIKGDDIKLLSAATRTTGQRVSSLTRMRVNLLRKKVRK
jgi:hypothetical protein